MKVLALALAAVGPWSPPQTIGADEAAALATVSADARGRTVLAWHTDAGTRLLAGGRERRLAGQPVALVPSGREAFLLLRRREREALLSTVSSNGAVTRGVRVTRVADELDVASNLAGRGAVAWVDLRRPDREVLRVRLRDPRGRLGAPITVATASRIRGVEVTVGPDGRIAVLYADTRRRVRRVHARLVRPRGRSFGRELRVGTHAGQARIRAQFASSGRLYAAWEHQDVGEEANRPPAVHASTLAPRGRRFAAEELVDRGDFAERTTGHFDLVVAPGGDATVAWTLVLRGYRYEARTAHAGRTGRFGEPLTVATDARLGDLDLGPDGEVWATMATASGDVIAAVRRAAGDFGSPETVASAEAAGLPAVSAAGRPTVVWTEPQGPRPRVRRSVRG